MIRLGTGSLLDFCSPSMRQDQFFAAVAKALDPFLADIRSKIAHNIIISQLGAQPENVLDFLALYHFNIDYYDTSYTYPVKLAMIQNVILDKSKKGTPALVKKQLSIAFNYAEVVEWWQTTPMGPPYTFTVLIADKLVDPLKVTKMINLILATKNVRSWFAGIYSLDTLDGILYVVPAIAGYVYAVLR
jgi:phage tail P2-like protein